MCQRISLDAGCIEKLEAQGGIISGWLHGNGYYNVWRGLHDASNQSWWR